MTKEEPDLPHYLRIADEIRAWIRNGGVPPKGKLPTEFELAHRFKVVRDTIRTALKVLKDEGLIESKPRVGYFVRDHHVMYWHMTKRDSPATTRGRPVDPWQHAITEGGYNGQQEIGIARVATSDVTLLGEFSLRDLLDGAREAVVRRRRRWVQPKDGASGDWFPYGFADSYYPADIADGTPIAEPLDIQPGIFPLLEKMGFERVGHRDVLSIRMPTMQERDNHNGLDLPPATPVWENLRRTLFDPGGKCRLVRHEVMTGNGSRLIYDLAEG